MKIGKETRAEKLETREDLFDGWTVCRWFSREPENGLLLKDQLFRIWLELFLALYDDLSMQVPAKSRRDAIFRHFTNEAFPQALDQFKWYASERAGSDIGLLRALEEISMQEWYIELLSRFSQLYQNK